LADKLYRTFEHFGSNQWQSEVALKIVHKEKPKRINRTISRLMTQDVILTGNSGKFSRNHMEIFDRQRPQNQQKFIQCSVEPNDSAAESQL